MSGLNLNNLLRLSIANLVLFVGVFLYLKQSSLTPKVVSGASPKNLGQTISPTISKPVVGIPQSSVPTMKQPTLSEIVSPHNSSGDCWIIYKTHVYDITGYFGMHPGGDEVMAKYCGRDAGTAFDTKDKSPVSPHSQTAVELLAQYLVK